MTLCTPQSRGRGIVRALGQQGTTGNFKTIAASKGKGDAIAALQNKLAKRCGQPNPFKGGRKKYVWLVRILDNNEALTQSSRGSNAGLKLTGLALNLNTGAAAGALRSARAGQSLLSSIG